MRGQAFGWTVLAYGGAELDRILAAHPKMDFGAPRSLVETAADLVLRPLEPAEHLPHLSGPFLLFGGSDDHLLPRRSAERMRELTPEPKTVVLFGSKHIGTGAGQQPPWSGSSRLPATG